MVQDKLFTKIVSDKNFEVSFKSKIIDTFTKEKVEKVALLATTEYEGIFKNGGIGTYYKTLSEKLAAEGWYVILILCYSEYYTEEKFFGQSKIPALKHIFSTNEIEQVLNLQSVHLKILSSIDKHCVDYHSFCCLFFTQAILSCFNQSLVYVEFQEMIGLGYRTLQAKQSNLLGGNCITAVTMHSGYEWIFEANERYIYEEYPALLWQHYHYEQYSFENADVAFFPSYYLKSKVESYGWKTSHALHMPYFVPLVELQSYYKNNISEISTEKIPIVFFGRLEERKGLCVFIEAIKSLDDEFKSLIHVIFIGKVVQLQSTKLKHLNSQEYIEEQLASEVSHSILPNFYSKEAIQFVSELNPIVCLTSNQENFPNSALEMGQLPVALIVSDTGGFHETLKLINRSSGVYWFKPKDSFSLSETIAKAVYAHPEKPEPPQRATIEQTNKDLLAQRIKYIEQAFRRAAITEHNQPKVTIGVTSYNLGKYLMECLTSIETQTYNNLDVIVIDDASTDEYTQEIFNHAKSLFPNYRFIKLDTNIGLGASRNYLINLAEGDYFLPLDAGNLLLPFAVEKFVGAACKSNAAIVTCPMTYFGIREGIHNFTGGSLPSLMKKNICGDACSLFSVKLLQKFKHPESKDVHTHDWDIMTAAVASGEKFAYYPYPLYEYRMRPDSIIESAFYPKEQYQLRQYLAQILPSEWSQRQIYMLLTACEQLLQLEERLHSQLHHAQSQTQQTQAELERTQSQTRQTQAELERTQSQLQQAQQRISAMETSKFWKLRKSWFKLKREIGLKVDE